MAEILITALAAPLIVVPAALVVIVAGSLIGKLRQVLR